uniref:Ubiquinol-cytochrome c reductase core protein 2a n=1 Tax=Sinocyclocheilus grahami TaxID=75366 RepID=A0A672P3X3_SINGR
QSALLSPLFSHVVFQVHTKLLGSPEASRRGVASVCYEPVFEHATTKGASAFRICRGLEAVGASLRSREHMVYSLDCLRDDFDGVIEYLINVTTAPDVRPWELSDLSPRVKIDKDVADQSPQIEGAYKNALSNSLYCPDHMLGKISVDHVSDVTAASDHLTNLHAALKQVGEQFFSTHSGVGAPGAKAVYRGGDGGGLVHALLACEGAAAGSAEANAFSVLQRLLGAGPHIKRGSDFTSKLSQGIAKATAQPFDVSACDAVAEGRLTADDLTRAKVKESPLAKLLMPI